MLKGEVFGRQLFENQIFALFINTFLNGNNGVCSDYLNGMAVTYSGNNVTIDSGAVCIQGRFLEEDTSTTLDAGNSNLFCKLVIEIDLDKINTEDSFNQGYYKVVTDSTGYPELTQTNIVGTNSGIYQYELARFKTSTSGITDFQDMRTTLSVPTIYDDIRQMVQDAIDSIEDGSAFALKTDIQPVTLYENDTGTSTNFTLNDDSSNYKRIIVEAKNIEENALCLVPEIIDPDGKKFPIVTINTGGGATVTYIGNSVWQIAGNQVTKTQTNCLTALHKNSNTDIVAHNNVRVTKVIGYKY